MAFSASTRLLSAMRQVAGPSRLVASRLPAPARASHRAAVLAMSGEGQLSSELMEAMRGKIEAALEAQQVVVTDVQGDGRHVEIVVVAKAFDGQSAVNRQRMVYKVRWRQGQPRCVCLCGAAAWGARQAAACDDRGPAAAEERQARRGGGGSCERG